MRRPLAQPSPAAGLVLLALAVLALGGCATGRYVAPAEQSAHVPLAQEIRTLVRAPRSQEVVVNAEGELAGTAVDAGAGASGVEDPCAEDPCEEGFRRHKLALILGVGHERDEAGGLIGLGYEYRLTRYIGASVQAEYLTGDFRESSVGVGLDLHPTERLFLVLGVGAAFERLDREAEFLVRLSVGYDFEIRERFSIAPVLSVDLVQDKPPVFLLALEIGRSW